ncbi:MAG: family 1 extracellular solute-binding protein [Paenibacillaceae bacterium]|jgi:putative aldouronate transport system substrate-binding protein|nr:family 1 extracellular solute-binding protein [Paenibacillaceae bacterium]
MENRKLNAKMALAASALLALTLAGCSKEGGTDAGSSASATAAATPEVRRDITVTTYDTGRVAQEEGTNEQNRWTKWINENGPANVKFTAISFAQIKEKTNVMYASGSAPDLLMVFDPTIRNPLYDQKQLLSLDDLIAKHSTVYKKLLEENPLLRKAGTKPDGKLYEIGHIQWVNPLRGVIIRDDWLKKLNLQAPKTTEELYQVAKAFTEQDPDGNGKKDTYGMALSGSMEYTVNQMFYAIKPWVVKDGKLTYSWENIKAVTEFKQRLYNEGIVDKDFFNDKNMAKAKQDFITGKLGIITPNFNSPQDLVLQYLDPLQKNVAGATMTLIPFPESPFGRFTPSLENPVQMTGAVSASTKNPEAVIKYIDFMASNSTADVLDNGLEGVHTKTIDGCPQIIDNDKFKKEVSDITVYMKMLTNTGLRFNKCSTPAVMYKSDPRVQEYYQLLRDTYLNFELPYAELTHSEHMPQLPKDLAAIVTNTDKQVNSMVGAGNGTIWARAIAESGKYSADAAQKDAMEVWEKAGGKQVEEWMANWYASDKDKAFLAKDMYEIAKQQDVRYKEIMKGLK